MTDSELIAILQGQAAAQAQHILVLEEKVMTLLQLLQKQGVIENSYTSSTDPIPRTKSLREPTRSSSGR